MTCNKLHYADLLITCSNHQRCKDDPPDPLPCPDDTHGNWQVPVKPASCGNAESVTPYAPMSGLSDPLFLHDHQLLLRDQ